MIKDRTVGEAALREAKKVKTRTESYAASLGIARSTNRKNRVLRAVQQIGGLGTALALAFATGWQF